MLPEEADRTKISSWAPGRNGPHFPFAEPPALCAPRQEVKHCPEDMGHNQRNLGGRHVYDRFMKPSFSEEQLTFFHYGLHNDLLAPFGYLQWKF